MARLTIDDLDPLTRRRLKLDRADSRSRQRPSRSEAKVQGNEEDGIHFVCLLCQHNERSYAAIERHATKQHPTRAVRIEQTGLTR
jgi:hypothetical protein